MGIDTAIEYADQVLYERTGRHLSDLQSCIIQQSWQGRTYGQVAAVAGYSEGHIKDVASQLWRLLSEALGERINKGNLRSRLVNRVKRTLKKASPLHQTPLIADLSAEHHLPTAALTRAIAPTAFIGREQALQTLQDLFASHRAIVIQGEGGIGKTTLAQQYCQRFDQTLTLLMAKEPANITPVESVVEEWLRQTFNEEPGREFGVTLSRLRHHLQTGSVAVLIDNLEPALDSNGQFIPAHRHYVELLRVLSVSGAPVAITSRDRLCEPGVNVHHYRLPGLSIESWEHFFQDRLSQSSLSQNREPTALASLPQMHRAYGGNAKAMEILCAAVLEDFEGDLSAYWQENGADLLATTDLRNLVVSQVNRLQALDADAYKVFCRLGCYRYQDQSRLKAAAIFALMWDIDSADRRQTLNSLRDRSLLEFRKGEYWLHPVSRAEAISRLRQAADRPEQSGDWQQANRAAATYWTNSVCKVVSLTDGLQALEAYYHLTAAQDYAAAAAVLLQSRHNQWRQFLPLAASLYRMGLLQPVINAITQVLPHLENEQDSLTQNGLKAGRSELNNILGDVYWITGKIHSAIACQQKTLAEAEQRLYQIELSPIALNQTQQTAEQKREIYYLKMLAVDAHLSMGLYCIDLWELTQAAEQFEQVIALGAGSDHQAWADKATVGLALVRSHQGLAPAAKALACRVYDRFTAGSDDERGRYAYFLQLLAQSFEQLGELEKAQDLYGRAIASSEASHYIQVKAKSLIGAAILQRKQNNYLLALARHTEAIELCETIGAKCDFAEASLQMGLTLAVAIADKSLDLGAYSQHQPAHYFEQATRLFSDIRAPRQVSRVTAVQTDLAD